MTMTNAVTACEEVLQKERAILVGADLLAEEIEVIDHMLARRLELADAYAELFRKLGAKPFALSRYLQSVVTAAALWNPAEIDDARNGRQRLRQVNSLIAKKAAELSELLEERLTLHNESGFSDRTYYHIGQVIESAGEANSLYRFWVRKPFRALKSEYGLKYWPRISECVAVLGRDAENVELEATDRITAAATEGKRGALAGHFKALFELIDENREDEGGPIPDDFKLTDNSVGSLANCALNLDADAMVDGAFVKRFRQRERDRLAAKGEDDGD